MRVCRARLHIESCATAHSACKTTTIIRMSLANITRRRILFTKEKKNDSRETWYAKNHETQDEIMLFLQSIRYHNAAHFMYIFFFTKENMGKE